MKKVLILKPRLDLPFKRFGLEKPVTNRDPIRVHWQNFVDKLVEYHKMKHDKVVVIEEQRWKFQNSMAQKRFTSKIFFIFFFYFFFKFFEKNLEKK